MKNNAAKSAQFRPNERSVGENSGEGFWKSKKLRNSTPRFARQQDEKRPFGRENSKTERSVKELATKTRIREGSLHNARGTGKVQVGIKSTRLSDKPKEKKTEALSPRAPEKIKKNRSEEMKICGENACLAVFKKRPESIIRVWTTVETAHRVGDLFGYLAANKKVYHVVDQAELERVTGTEHHGGICMLVKKARPFTLAGYLEIPREQDCLVLLDTVRNPQNIGAVVRTCAVFGVKGLLIDEPELLNSAAATRVAEGGMEYIHNLRADNIDAALASLRKAGYQIIHSSTDKQAPGLNRTKLADKVAFVLSETSTQALVRNQDLVLNLSPANPLKNGLNVAVTAGVLLSAWAQK